jgi:hypothetical protein
VLGSTRGEHHKGWRKTGYPFFSSAHVVFVNFKDLFPFP